MFSLVFFWLGLSLLVVPGTSFQLRSSATEIHSGSPTPIDLKCFHAGTRANIVKVTGIRIRRKDNDSGRFVTVASLEDKIETTSPNVTAEGKIGDSLEETFLNAVVEGGAQEKAGIYFCDFCGIDVYDDFCNGKTNIVVVTPVDDSDKERLKAIRNRVEILREELKLYKEEVTFKLNTLFTDVMETVQATHATATDCVITEDQIEKWKDSIQGGLIDEALMKTGHLIQNRFEESQCEEDSLETVGVIPGGDEGKAAWHESPKQESSKAERKKESQQAIKYPMTLRVKDLWHSLCYELSWTIDLPDIENIDYHTSCSFYGSYTKQVWTTSISPSQRSLTWRRPRGIFDRYKVNCQARYQNQQLIAEAETYYF